jgi:hypothetical protein
VELREALTQISEIRRHLAQAEKFQGYRAVPIGCGAALAVLGAAAQPWIVPAPASDVPRYLAFWIAIAFVAVALAVVDVYLAHRNASQLRTVLAQLALDQFAPCVLAGALLTCVIAYRVPQATWMLPGLWSVLFSLGIFASYRLLPRSTFLVALWYLGFGCVLLALGPRVAFEPWTMGIAFGAGQAFCALVLAVQPRGEVHDD